MDVSVVFRRFMNRTLTCAAILAAQVFLLLGCRCGADSASDLKECDVVAVGRTTYVSLCASCHNSNPNLAGSLGPDVAGSSLELLRAKILLGSYPEGYTPKRKSQAMAKIPLSEDKLLALAAYLEQVKKP